MSPTPPLPTRSIGTRLMDACAFEAETRFGQDPRLKSLYSDGRGTWRIERRPLLPGEAAQLPAGALYLYALPIQYKTGTGGVTLVDYRITFQFVMTRSALTWKKGDRSWLDDPLVLLRWLYLGGSHPNNANNVGNIFDPDYPGNDQKPYLTVSNMGFQFVNIEAFLNQNVCIEVSNSWQTYEDSQGNRV